MILYKDTLKEMRRSKNFSQQKVADLLGIDRSTYTCYETGKTKPDFETILKLCDIFGTNIVEFIEQVSRPSQSIFSSEKPEYNTSRTSDADAFVKLTKDEMLLVNYFRVTSNKDEIMDYIRERIKEDSLK